MVYLEGLLWDGTIATHLCIFVVCGNEGNGPMTRHHKDSFWWYQRCTASNGTDLD